MDPFTKQILEKAEKRSKILGISTPPKIPIASSTNNTQIYDIDYNECDSSNKKNYQTTTPIANTYRTAWTNASSASKRDSFREKDVDVEIGINIRSKPNIEVQVEIEEQNITETETNTDEYSSITVTSDPENQIEAMNEDNKNKSHVNDRLKRLNALYSGNEISSPIHKSENKFHIDLENEENNKGKRKPIGKRLRKLDELADEIKHWEDDLSHPPLKQQEQIQQHRPASTSVSESDGKQESLSLSTGKSPLKDTKQLKWDKTVYDSLEAQGFQRRQSSAKLVYDYKQPDSEHHDENIHKKIQKNSKNEQKVEFMKNKEKNTQKELYKSPAKEIKPGLVSQKAHLFENKTKSPNTDKQKDPAEMSLKERVLLFEKNKGQAPLPKTTIPVTPTTKEKSKQKITQNKENQINNIKDYPAGEIKVKDKVAALLSGSSTISEQQIKADITKQRQQEMDELKNRFNSNKVQENKNEIPPPPPMVVTFDNCTINYNKRRSPLAQLRNSSDGNKQSDDAKRAKILSPLKNTSPKRMTTSKRSENQLYPNLSDLESIESDNGNCTTATMSTPSIVEIHHDDDHSKEEEESSADEDFPYRPSTFSLGPEIRNFIGLNKDEKIKRNSSINSSTTSVDSNRNLGDGIDDYLDEALHDDEDSNNGEDYKSSMREDKNFGTTASNSFSYQKRPTKHVHYKTITEEDEQMNDPTYHREQRRRRSQEANITQIRNTPIRSELILNKTDNVVTVIHTVGLRNKEQSNINTSSEHSKKVIHQHVFDDNKPSTSKKTYRSSDSSNTDTDEDFNENQNLVQEKITHLLNEVHKQQQIISQTSQALNLCASTIEFSGSTEAMEGERHLLVAMHRRQACIDEIQRLNIEGTLRPRPCESTAPLNEKGRVTVSEITLPLKDEYVQKLAANAVSGHNLVCLLKYGETVLATNSIPTLPGLKSVKFPDVLRFNNVYGDFKITVEIYGMTTQREVLSHNAKYHIGDDAKKIPKKKKLNDSVLVMPRIQSPGGPQVVRNPALVKYGFCIFSIAESKREFWTITPTISLSPLKDIIQMKVKCELSVSVVHKGFLTMFEDINGTGAWIRRWCCLNKDVIKYWKYPEDEKTTKPIGIIDLKICITRIIKTAPRDITARLNTLLLECERPREESEKRTLLTIPKSNTTLIRYLLSADSKEERDQWCNILNKALTIVRTWNLHKS